MTGRSDEGGDGRPPILCVVGKKDSGKTGLVVRLVAELTRRGRRVMTIKHGHGFDLDTPGTDSWRHREEGRALRVVLAGPDEVAVMGAWGPDGEAGPEELAARFLHDAELVVAEGYKGAALPKIEVFRSEANGDPLYDPDRPGSDFVLALVTDGGDLDVSIPVFQRDDPALIGKVADLTEETLLDRGGRG